MEDNLILLLNKLSYQIVTRVTEERSLYGIRKDERHNKKLMRRLSQKGCDVLLGKSSEEPVSDPCVTDYGGNWSPLTLLADLGTELKAIGAFKSQEILMNSINCLQQDQYNCVNELFKLMLLLRGPCIKPLKNSQNDMLFSMSDSIMTPIESFSVLSTYGFSIEGLSRGSSHRRALKYEESWTKNFDTKFELLGECSKNNLLVPEKMSIDSIFTARSFSKSHSQSNLFVLTDFFSEKSYASERNTFYSSSSLLNNSLFLDGFIDNPITHKLPSISLTQKSSRSGIGQKSYDQIKRKLQLLPEEEHIKDFYDEYGISDTFEESTSLKSIIELKRSSNYSHSFSILYEKPKSHTCFEESNESVMLFKGKRRDKMFKDSGIINSSSREIILALWEQEHALIREFRPELAVNIPTLRMITVLEFVEDVKYLLTGITSHTFHLTQENTFIMEYGTCLEDITPDSLFHFSKEFLEVGNYYVGLKECTTKYGKNNFEACTTICQVFWKSVFDFLELHYSVVLEIPFQTNLMALKSCTKDLHEMMVTVGGFCKVSKSSESLPEGGELLTYLLQVTEKLNRQCNKNIGFGILQNCCNVYFMSILQNWMFKGHIETENNEFFVDFKRQKVKTKSRSYYKSFYIVHEKVPCFLRGYEESIYNCGKSIHFLKLFNSEDKFCQILEKADYPSMHLCLSDDQLGKLEKEFEDYENRVIESCCEKVSVINIKNEEREKEKYFQEYVKECKRIQEHQRQLLKLQKLKDLKAKKEMQNKLLNEQRSMVEAEKERKRLQEEEEKRVPEEVNTLTNRKLVEEEKSSIKHYYDNLLKNLETRLNITELRKKNLQELLSSSEIENKTENDRNLLNDNYNEFKTDTQQFDSEGNVIGILDINLNSGSLLPEDLPEISISQASGSLDVLDENYNPNSDLSTNPIIKAVDSDNFSQSSSCKNFFSESTSFMNFSLENLKLSENNEKVGKSISYQTFAVKEAVKNKFKVLKYDIRSGIDVKTMSESDSQKSLSEFERNKRKVLDSEFNILKNGSDEIMLKPVPSRIQVSVGNKLPNVFWNPKTYTQSLKEVYSFREVALERTFKCMNLEQIPQRKKSEDCFCEVFAGTTDSADSFLSPLSATQTEESITYASDIKSAEAVDLPKDSESKLMAIEPKYLSSLSIDSKISQHKLSFQDVFHSLKEIENDNLFCTDFMKLQRFLKKSVLIPLKVQEKLANNALLNHLLRGENLLSHLKSLRGYFFLNDGEFGRSFTSNIFRSLAKCTEPQQFFERSNLSNIVNEALNYTIHSYEPNSHNLSFQIVKMPPFLNHSSHDVLSPFELSYKVEWPLSIILTEKALSKYKMIFKFLLKLKRINWTLNENFILLNSYFKNKRLNSNIIKRSSHYHMIQIFRHAITQIMITLDDYIFSNGIQFPWIFFLKDLETTENIDHLYQKHVRYVKDVLTRCFLSNSSKDLLECIHSLIELALKFHYTSKSSALEVVNGRYEHPKFHVLKNTFNEFCTVMKTFLGTLKEKLYKNQVLKSHHVLLEKFNLKLE